MKLTEPLLDPAMTTYAPTRLIYDKAADSGSLRERLTERGVELSCLHRKNHVREPTQDGRKLPANGRASQPSPGCTTSNG